MSPRGLRPGQVNLRSHNSCLRARGDFPRSPSCVCALRGFLPGRVFPVRTTRRHCPAHLPPTWVGWLGVLSQGGRAGGGSGGLGRGIVDADARFGGVGGAGAAGGCVGGRGRKAAGALRHGHDGRQRECLILPSCYLSLVFYFVSCLRKVLRLCLYLAIGPCPQA